MSQAIGGDYFGMNNDNFNFIDKNVSTVLDLLDTKGISWGEYQEDQPYSGFEGPGYVNQQTVRTTLQHPPLVTTLIHPTESKRLRSQAQPGSNLQLCLQLRRPPLPPQELDHVLQRPSGQHSPAVDVYHPQHDVRRARLLRHGSG